jgi:hypothetical protein
MSIRLRLIVSINYSLILLSSLRTHPLGLRHILYSLQPPNPCFNKLLCLRPKLRLMQLEVVDRTNPAEAEAWEAATAAIHKGATNRAKGAGHRVTRANGFIGTVSSELILATGVH